MLETVQSAAQATRVKRALELARHVGFHEDLGAACRALQTAVIELLDADRAHVVLCDVGQGIAWREEDEDAEIPLYRGLVAQVVQHGRSWWAPQASATPGYYRPLDDPQGNGHEALMLQPVTGRTGEIHAVLVAVRTPGRAAFDPFDLHLLGVLAIAVGPVLDQLSWVAQAEAIIADDPNHDRMAQVHRNRRERSRRGDVVRVTPRWIGGVFWVLLLVVAASLVALAVARTGRYATGHVVIRAQGRTEVVAPVAGSLARVDVHPGQHVEAGQVLARLDDETATADLARLEQAWQAQLRQRLLDPSDGAAQHSAAALRRERDAAREALRRREIRAPAAGRVVDIRLRAGQPIGVGESLLVLVDDARPLEVLALFPGHQRPELHPGMNLRLELAGYPYEYQALTVASVDEQVIGPAEAQRLLGPQIADSLPMQGALAVVRAPLPTREFSTEDGLRTYHDGMQGTAELLLHEEPVLYALLPALEHL